MKNPPFRRVGKNNSDCDSLLLALFAKFLSALLSLDEHVVGVSEDWSRREMFQPFQVNQHLIPLLCFAFGRVRRVWVREEL